MRLPCLQTLMRLLHGCGVERRIVCRFVMWTAPGGLPQCPSCEQANAQWERMTASQNQRGSPISFGQVRLETPQRAT